VERAPLSVNTAVMRWQRLDECQLERGAEGWCLRGIANFELEGEPAELAYDVACDASYCSRRAHVHGSIGRRQVDFVIEHHDAGWYLNGKLLPALTHCIDVDIGFTPATNLLPIRRLVLREGEAAEVDAAWLDVSRDTLERLPQRYQRQGKDTYRYESPSHGYVAMLTVDDADFVVDYPGLWRATRGDVPFRKSGPNVV
jgi:hypothetical protein